MIQSKTIEIDATNLFEDDNVNWKYCKEHATFSHKEACEFIIHIGEEAFAKRVIDEMIDYGCTDEFIDSYLAAESAGADRVLFYV